MRSVCPRCANAQAAAVCALPQVITRRELQQYADQQTAKFMGTAEMRQAVEAINEAVLTNDEQISTGISTIVVDTIVDMTASGREATRDLSSRFQRQGSSYLGAILGAPAAVVEAVSPGSDSRGSSPVGEKQLKFERSKTASSLYVEPRPTTIRSPTLRNTHRS